MANEGGKAARQKKRAEKRAKKKTGAKAGSKEKNPVVQAARARFTEELRKQGTADDQVRTKVKAHLKEVVKPAMNEAKATAKSKNLKGAEKKKYIQDTVRAKLGLPA